MKKIIKTFSYSIASIVIFMSVANISWIEQKRDHIIQKNNTTNSEAKDFIDDLNNLSPGDTYELKSDIDLSDLSDLDTIELLDNITLNGNGHKIYNRTLEDKKDFTLENDSKELYFFKEIKNSIINNLTFENVLFPIYDLFESSLVNVNFKNTSYEEMQFTINKFDKLFEENDGIIHSFTIGLFLLKMENSTINNFTAENISFNNNVIDNHEETLDIEKNIIVSMIGYVDEIIDSESDNPTNIFKNIYIDNIIFSDNFFIGTSLYDWTEETSIDYGSLSSIILTPTIGGIVGYKENDSYAKLTTDFTVIDNITFANNKSEITNNTTSLETGSGQGIFYSLGSVVNVGTQLTFSNAYVFNLNIEQDEALNTLLLTGFMTTLNNYEGISKAFTKTKEAYFYQEDLLNEFLGFSNILYQSSTYNTMIENINIGTIDSEQNSNEVVELWDENVWEKQKELTSVDKAEKIVYHNTPWIDSQENFDYQKDKITINGKFRKGSFQEDKWNITIESEDTTFFTKENLLPNEEVKINFKTDELLNPNKNIFLNFVSGEMIDFKTIFDTSNIVPKITNVTNQWNIIKTGKIEKPKKLKLIINFENTFNYQINFVIKLFNGQKLVEKVDKTLIDSVAEKQITFISTTLFPEIKTFDNYYYDINISFINQNNVEERIYDNIINYDNDNSLISYQHYKEKKSSNWIIIVSIIVLILLLFFVIYLIIFFVKRKNNKTEMIKAYGDVTGIQLTE